MIITASRIVLTKSWTLPDEGLKHFLTDFQGQGFVKKRNFTLFLFRSKFENFPRNQISVSSFPCKR